MKNLFATSLTISVLSTTFQVHADESVENSDFRNETASLVTKFSTKVKIPSNVDLECISNLDYSDTSWHYLSWSERSVYKNVKLKFETAEGVSITGTIYGTKKIEDPNYQYDDSGVLPEPFNSIAAVVVIPPALAIRSLKDVNDVLDMDDLLDNEIDKLNLPECN